MPPKPKIAIGETGLPSLGGSDGEGTKTLHTETIQVENAEEGRKEGILLIVNGLDAGRVVSLGRAEVSIGRAPECAVVVPDRGVSAHHARLTLRGPADGDNRPEAHRNARFLLEDLRSKNGTFVGGVAVTNPRELVWGDSFQIGPDVILRLSLVTPAEDHAARQLYASSMRDSLTGVYNRRYFGQRLHAELAHSARHGNPVSVLVVNFDQFKKVNDDHGHGHGDAALQALAKALQTELRAEDVLARIESQDFGVLVRGLDARATIACAERIRGIVAKTALPHGGSVTASVGIAMSSDNSENMVELASARLRTAKSLGRDRVCWS